VIVAVASAKGGVGKTTTALHLAGALAASAPTLLVDDDPNASAIRYAERALAGGQPLPFHVCAGARRRELQDQYEHLVIDTPARADPADVRALAAAADHLVVPTTPDAMSLEAAIETTAELHRASSWALLLTICPPPPERDADDAHAALTAAGLPVHGTRIRRAKVYAHAAAQGRLVWDLPGARAKRAGADYMRLATEILDRASTKEGTRP